MLLVQFKDRDGNRRVGRLEDNGKVRPVKGAESTYKLAAEAIARGCGLGELVDTRLDNSQHDHDYNYDQLLADRSLLPPLDHPEPAHCIVTGTGLTHLGSADTRDAMHKKVSGAIEALTDSMKMFRMGLEGGKQKDKIGVQPEWFYKGDGSILRGCGQPLVMPDFSQDGGEEPEIAGLYVIAPDGKPYRLGFALGNEFSDHVMERQNYLWLAHSKLRQCSVGPAVRVGALPSHVEGVSRVLAPNGRIRWEKPFLSGEANMSHYIGNLEHHHFKYALFRRPGDVHVHFFGTATLSFADGVRVEPGEIFEIEAEGFGKPLRNALAVEPAPDTCVAAL
jgi:hypothetical protein